MQTLFENNMDMVQTDMLNPRDFPPIVDWIVWNEGQIENNLFHFRVYHVELIDGNKHALQIEYDGSGSPYIKITFINKHVKQHYNASSTIYHRTDYHPLKKYKDYELSSIGKEIGVNGIVEISRELTEDILKYIGSLIDILGEDKI